MSFNDREIYESRSVFKGQIVEVVVERIRTPDGRDIERETVRHPGAVAVVPVAEDGNILMVRQGRHAVDNLLLELPAGKLDADEDPWDCAKRELEEETGYRCGSLELLVSYYSTPGFSDEKVHVFLSRQITKVAEAPTLDGDEPISIEWLHQDEALAAVLDGRIVDSKTIIGITLLKLQEHPEDLGVEF